MRAAIAAVVLVTLSCTAAREPEIRDEEAQSLTAPRDVVEERLDALVAEFAGDAAIYVADPSGAEPLYAVNAGGRVVTASLYKLAVLLHAESLVESGAESYSERITITSRSITPDGSRVRAGDVVTLDRALELMITYSDNGTALELWYRYGPQVLNATLAREGIDEFFIAETPDQDNWATARAVGTFFTRLARLELVSPAASARMLERLERQTISDRLPALLPEGTRVAHKTGNLPQLVHDAGILFGPRGTRVVVAMTSGASTPEATSFIARIAQAVYETIR